MCALLAVCFVAAAEEPRLAEVRLTDTPLRVVLDHYAECREIARPIEVVAGVDVTITMATTNITLSRIEHPGGLKPAATDAG